MGRRILRFRHLNGFHFRKRRVFALNRRGGGDAQPPPAPALQRWTGRRRNRLGAPAPLAPRATPQGPPVRRVSPSSDLRSRAVPPVEASAPRSGRDPPAGNSG